jgi:hypothetical protein
MPAYARALQIICFTEKDALEVVASRQHTLSAVLESVGRRTWSAQIHSCRRLLLPLFQDEEPGKLRQDV